MAFTVDEQRLISQLSDMMENLFITLDRLGEETIQCYQLFHKVKNILKSKDRKGMKNVKQHLMKEFRMIEDRQLQDDDLDDLQDKIYYLVSNNNIFHS